MQYAWVSYEKPDRDSTISHANELGKTTLLLVCVVHCHPWARRLENLSYQLNAPMIVDFDQIHELISVFHDCSWEMGIQSAWPGWEHGYES